uniref:Uncharacterized protein n=1 Tax=Arundo donax TaxID=35708 RepID=A0A0A9G2X7_ARUDO
MAIGGKAYAGSTRNLLSILPLSLTLQHIVSLKKAAYYSKKSFIRLAQLHWTCKFRPKVKY